MNYFISCIKDKYCCFSGRARRKEYWMFVLFNIIFSFVIGFISVFLANVTNVTAFLYLSTIYNLAMILPGLSVGVRRLHDTDKSGWFVLLGLIPIVGAIILLVFMCLDSNPGANRFGPNPKGLG